MIERTKYWARVYVTSTYARGTRAEALDIFGRTRVVYCALGTRQWSTPLRASWPKYSRLLTDDRIMDRAMAVAYLYDY